MSANPQRGEVPFTADGVDWTLRYSTNALCAIEAMVGKPVPALVEELQATPSLTTMRAMFAGGVKPAITQEQAGELIDTLGFDKAGELVGAALALAFPAEKAGAANPRKAAARK